MKRIYLDWGVISNLKKPEFAEVRDFLLSHKRELFVVYSPAHFEDAMRSDGDDRLSKDIEMLESLVGDHLLCYGKGVTRPYRATPSLYYRDQKGRDLDVIPDISELMNSISQSLPETASVLKSFLDLPLQIPESVLSQEIFRVMFPELQESVTLNDVFRHSVCFVNKMSGDRDAYKSFRSAAHSVGFKLDPNAGNWKSDEVVPNISRKIKALGINKTFKEFVLSGFGSNGKVDNFKFFIAAYSMMDMIGYKSDKLPKPTNAMNSVSTDAQHAYYAAFCDYFITQDACLTSKSLALYSALRIPTKVISLKDVIAILEDNENNEDLVSFLGEHIKEENIERREDGATIYKLKRRFLGIFTHCVVYDYEDAMLLEFKLAFDNYSYFIFYDEAAIMVDTVSDYMGRPSGKDYETARKRIISGDLDVSINWDAEDVKFTLRADPERHRPELYVKINKPLIIC